MAVEYRYQRESIHRDLEDIQKTFEQGLALDMWQMNQESLRSTVEGMLEIPTVVGVKIQAADGENVAVGGIIHQGDTVGEVGQYVNLLGLNQGESEIHPDDIYNFDVFEHQFPIVYMYEDEAEQQGEVTIYSNTSVVLRRVKVGFLLLVINAMVKTVALWIIFLWFSNILLRRPLVALASATEKVNLSNLDSFQVKIETSGRNELKALEESFNTMIDNLHQSVAEREQAEKKLASNEEQLRQSQKMDAIGQLAGGVAHDFNNMLGGILGASELLESRLADDPKGREFNTMIMESAERAAGLTDKLLAFARKQPLASSAIDVHQVLADTVSLLQNTIDRRIKINMDLAAESFMVIGAPPQLQSAMLNLGINASHAMPDGGTIYVVSRTVELDRTHCNASTFDIEPGFYLEIEIRDTGSGIAPKDLPRIFEPFFTTKEQGKGTGLGLSAVFGTIQQHHGSITVSSELGTGTSFCIALPLADHDAETQRNLTAQAIPGTGRILVVDDEAIMRATAKSILEDLGYEVLLAEDGKQAIAMYSEDPDAIDLVLLDMIMPEMNGRDCFEAMQEIAPNVRVVITSGFTSEKDVEQMKAAGLCGFILKPYRSATLSQIVHDSIHE